MNNPAVVIRSLLIYCVCIPLAIWLGYLIAGPLDYTSYSVFVILLALLVFPLLLRWHHVWLITTWNLSLTLFFLPASPPMWFVMAFLSFFIAGGHYILNRRKFLAAPSVAWSLICLGLVVLITAKLTGGVGLKMAGSSNFGGKRYFWIWIAILGYFAFTSEAVSPRKRNLYVALFFLGGMTQMIGDTVGFVSPSFYFLFQLFPADSGGISLLNQPVSGDFIARLGGLANGSIVVLYALMARYGIAGIMNPRNSWRGVLFLLFLGLSMLGGYRSLLILISLTFGIVFYLEGLMRSRLMPVALFMLLFAATISVAFVDRLPLNIQRALSVLPLRVDPVARMSAEDTSEWRVNIWKRVLPQIPNYLIIGKGYTFSGSEMASVVNTRNPGANEGEGAEMAGDYHNGPLSVIIPFGIFGVTTFLWFLVASFQVLKANYRYGEPDCKRINTFLFGFYIAKVILFFFVFGGLYGDLAQFVGLVGLSISVNGGVAKPNPEDQAQPAFRRLRAPAGKTGLKAEA
jgi:hypothetical protein